MFPTSRRPPVTPRSPPGRCRAGEHRQPRRSIQPVARRRRQGRDPLGLCNRCQGDALRRAASGATCERLHCRGSVGAERPALPRPTRGGGIQPCARHCRDPLSHRRRSTQRVSADVAVRCKWGPWCPSALHLRASHSAPPPHHVERDAPGGLALPLRYPKPTGPLQILSVFIFGLFRAARCLPPLELPKLRARERGREG